MCQIFSDNTNQDGMQQHLAEDAEDLIILAMVYEATIFKYLPVAGGKLARVLTSYIFLGYPPY